MEVTEQKVEQVKVSQQQVEVTQEQVAEVVNVAENKQEVELVIINDDKEMPSPEAASMITAAV